MATISDMPIPSVTQMTLPELIDLMRDIRASRRINKRRTKKARAATKKTTKQIETKLKSLNEDRRNALIDQMLKELGE